MMKSPQYASVENQYELFPKLQKQDIQELDDWVRGQPHLPSVSESELMLFHHANYYKLSATKKNIEAYYTFRTSCKDFFYDRDVLSPSLAQAMSMLALYALPGTTEEGHTVVMGKLVSDNTDKFVLADIVKLITICLDLTTLERGCTKGYKIVLDIDSVHVGHVPKLGFFTMKNVISYFTEIFPIRLKAVHFVNVAPFISKVYAMMKPFIRKEFTKMIHFHQDIKSLSEHIPRSLLCSEYEGNSDSMSTLTKFMLDKCVEHRDFIRQMERLEKIDQSKRPKTNKLLGFI